MSCHVNAWGCILAACVILILSCSKVQPTAFLKFYNVSKTAHGIFQRPRMTLNKSCNDGKLFYFEIPDQNPVPHCVWLDTWRLRCCTGCSLVLYCASCLLLSAPYAFSACFCDTGISGACCAVSTQRRCAKKSGDALSGPTLLMVASFHRRPHPVLTGASSSSENGPVKHRLCLRVFFSDKVTAVF